MTRNTAREIAAHLAYEWNFTDLPVGEFLDRRLAPECFAELAPECGLYADAPNAKQAQYIRRLVAGVADHAAGISVRKNHGVCAGSVSGRAAAGAGAGMCGALPRVSAAAGGFVAGACPRRGVKQNGEESFRTRFWKETME